MIPVKNIIFIFLVVVSGNLFGQTLTVDSTKIEKVPAEAEVVHSPRKATIYSAVLPGLGQAYNKKYWKIPIIYAGFGTIGYFIGWNNGFYKTYKLAYSDLTDDDLNTDSYLDLLPPGYNLDDPTTFNNFKSGLSKQSEYYRRNRDLLIISMIGFYGLNIIDASVDAHLFDFDISEDLTMNWQPAVQTFEKQLVYGANFTFKF
ncbi:MAG TPA: DUF5683 domain-containing protein [Draconibacterium sp.]|nr:DUF5683 domain-containing protein [Draconibacterium sp.]HRX11090.1 DUF5683 domain-containing protein [Draconibacterium sp.]